MSELNKILNKDEGGEKKDPQNPSPEDIKNLNSSLETEKTRAEKAEKDLADEKFNGRFSQLSSLYPHAKDFKDVIREKVNNGYDIDDALISTLQKENKLTTAEQMAKEENKGAGAGGSAPTPDLNAAKPGEKTLAELEQDFREAEAKGEIRIS